MNATRAANTGVSASNGPASRSPRPPPSLTQGSNEAITITVDRGYINLHGAGTSLVAILGASHAGSP